MQHACLPAVSVVVETSEAILIPDLTLCTRRDFSQEPIEPSLSLWS